MASSATVWGSPTASKCALCLHGLIGASPTWHRVAERLVMAGYMVIAPDALGHGLAPHAPGNDYSMHMLAQAYVPYLTPPPDLIIGHSLGGPETVHLLPHLPEGHKARVVLEDPALEVADSVLESGLETAVSQTTYPPGVNEYMKAHPNWIKEGAIIWEYGVQLCDPNACVEIVNQNNKPRWSYTSLLPSTSERFSVTIIAADPTKGAAFNAEQVAALAQSHPHIRVVTAHGVGHDVHMDSPDLVADIALGIK